MTNTATSKELAVVKKVSVVLAAIYAPYLFLLVTLEWSWTLIKIWPIFPGAAIHAIQLGVLQQVFGLNVSWPVDSLLPVIVLTLVFLGAAIFAGVKARKSFWIVITSLAIIASALMLVFRQLLRA